MLIKYSNIHSINFPQHPAHTADTEKLSLSKKIENEIFDKSIEDIEKIFNFKINNDLNFKESLTSSLSSSAYSTNSSAQKKQQRQMINSRKRKQEQDPQINNNNKRHTASLSSKRENSSKSTTATTIEAPHISNDKVSTAMPAPKTSFPQKRPQRSTVQPLLMSSNSSQDIRSAQLRHMASSIYLQDFNMFRDDLLDELFDLKESLRTLR